MEEARRPGLLEGHQKLPGSVWTPTLGVWVLIPSCQRPLNLSFLTFAQFQRLSRPHIPSIHEVKQNHPLSAVLFYLALSPSPLARDLTNILAVQL